MEYYIYYLSLGLLTASSAFLLAEDAISGLSRLNQYAAFLLIIMIWPLFLLLIAVFMVESLVRRR